MTTEAVIHVIDDDAAACDSLAFLLEAAGLRVKVYPSAEEFLLIGDRAEPGCIVTDMRMSGLSGLDLARRIKERNWPFPIIIMTGHGDIPLAVEAMKAGVFDFLEKPFDDKTMLASIRGALEARAGTQGDEEKRAAILERLERLSDRERQVLRGLVAGKANKAIASDLGISPRTVEVYRANVMSKMSASNLSMLVRMAIAAGLR